MKRVATNVILFLLLGAIVNVAVAWGAAFYQHDISAEALTDENTRRGASTITGSDFIVVGGTADFRMVTVFIIGHDDADSKPDDVDAPIERVAPRWADISRHVRVDAHDSPDGELFVAHGWPCRAAWCKYAMSNRTLPSLAALNTPNADVSCGLKVNNRSWRFGIVLFQSALPMAPIVPGFAINTIFYAAILWLPVAGLGALRRRRRIKRGLCARCGYPAGTSPVCSECGTPVSRK